MNVSFLILSILFLLSGVFADFTLPSGISVQHAITDPLHSTQYFCGSFSSSVIVNKLGLELVTPHSIGVNDAFIAQVDESSGLVWLLTLGGFGISTTCKFIALSSSGEIFVSGESVGNGTIVDQNSLNVPVSGTAIFHAQVSKSGSLHFAKAIEADSLTSFYLVERRELQTCQYHISGKIQSNTSISSVALPPSMDGMMFNAAFNCSDGMLTAIDFDGEHLCFGRLSSDAKVCSGAGKCVALDTCQCFDNSTSSDCGERIFSCFEYSSISPHACSGNGVCIASNTCSCNIGYGESDCSREVSSKDSALLMTYSASFANNSYIDRCSQIFMNVSLIDRDIPESVYHTESIWTVIFAGQIIYSERYASLSNQSILYFSVGKFVPINLSNQVDSLHIHFSSLIGSTTELKLTLIAKLSPFIFDVEISHQETQSSVILQPKLNSSVCLPEPTYVWSLDSKLALTTMNRNVARIEIPKDTFPDFETDFRFTVSSSLSSAGLFATASAIVSISPQATVSLYSNADPSTKFSTQTKLRAVALVTNMLELNQTEIEYEWSVYTSDIGILFFRIDPRVVGLTYLSESAVEIPPNGMHYNKYYMLQCSVTYRGRITTELLTIRTSSPPKKGELKISPSYGLALTTEFTIEAKYFQDDLEFSFSFGSGSDVKSLTPFSSNSKIETKLPPGTANVIVNARNRYGDITSVATSVQITDVSSAQKVSYLRQSLQSFQANGTSIDISPSIQILHTIDQTNKTLQSTISELLGQLANYSYHKLTLEANPDTWYYSEIVEGLTKDMSIVSAESRNYTLRSIAHINQNAPSEATILHLASVVERFIHSDSEFTSEDLLAPLNSLLYAYGSTLLPLEQKEIILTDTQLKVASCGFYGTYTLSFNSSLSQKKRRGLFSTDDLTLISINSTSGITVNAVQYNKSPFMPSSLATIVSNVISVEMSTEGNYSVNVTTPTRKTSTEKEVITCMTYDKEIGEWSDSYCTLIHQYSDAEQSVTCNCETSVSFYMSVQLVSDKEKRPLFGSKAKTIIAFTLFALFVASISMVPVIIGSCIYCAHAKYAKTPPQISKTEAYDAAVTKL